MTITEMNAGVPEAIERIIKKKGMKKCAIASMANIEKNAFSEMLNGRRLIKLDDLLRISRALGVSPNDMFFNEAEKE